MKRTAVTAVALMLVGMSQEAWAATKAEVMAAKIQAMRIAFACSEDHSRGVYRAAYEAARRAAMMYSHEVEKAERQVFNLHKGLRDGSIVPPHVEKSDCGRIVEDAMEEARLLQDELY